MTARGGLFAGVDRAVFASAYADRLRRAGVPATLTATERCARALGAMPTVDLDRLYWLLRVSFVTDRRDIETFDRVFAAVFDTEMGRLPTERRGQQSQLAADDDPLTPVRRRLDEDADEGAGLPWATLPSVVANDDPEDAADGVEIRELRPSSTAVDADRPFDLLDERELAEIGALLESAVDDWPRRRSRRRSLTRTRGSVALRPSVRGALRTGGDLTTLVYSTAQTRPRRVVMVLDVSGSMEHYARAYLHVMRPLALRHQAEVFAFATDLTRVTAALRHRSPVEAIEQLNDAVGDRFGGTRVGESLRTLLHHRSWGTSVRGAVVVICSDGWDAGDPAVLERQMGRLTLLAHRVIWVNPRAAAAGFEPITGGMAAALPHCDEFLAGNTARSMSEVVRAITAR